MKFILAVWKWLGEAVGSMVLWTSAISLIIGVLEMVWYRTCRGGKRTET